MGLPLFNTNNKFIVIWEVYIFLITIMAAILTPLIIVFDIRDMALQPFLETLLTISFLLDIGIQFSTTYAVRQVLITDRNAIARRYLRSWFVIDLLAALPVVSALSFLGFGRYHKILQYLRLMRMLKLLRAWKTLNRARKLRFINPAIMKLSLLVFWILIAAHLVSCGWIFIGGNSIIPDLASPSSQHQQYMVAFYWTITTLTTIGYGDITPRSEIQLVYATFVMLLGAAIYGVIIGNIANIIASIDIAKSQFREKMENISTFLKYRNIPGKIQTRIREYYDYLWESRRGYEESQLLSDLPKSLKTQVAFILNREIIEKVPLFKGAGHGFIRDVVLNLKPVIYTPGDAVVVYGEIGHEMYFINRGELDVTNQDGSITYATLTSGQYFGEIALLLSAPRTATVRSQNYCDLYVLDKNTFDRILRRYPRFADNVEAIAATRRRELGLNEDMNSSAGAVEEGNGESPLQR